MKITRCVIPETWSTTDKIYCHFGTFFVLYLSPPPPPHPPNNPTQITKTLKKKWKKCMEILSFYDNHMIYGSWDMKCNRQNFFSHLVFYPTNNLKNQNLEKGKNKRNPWRYHHFTEVQLTIIIICYNTPAIWCMTDVIFILHFGLIFPVIPHMTAHDRCNCLFCVIFCPLTLLTAQKKWTFQKNQKKA